MGASSPRRTWSVLVALGALALAQAACPSAATRPAPPERPRPAGEGAWIAAARGAMLEADHDGSGSVEGPEVEVLPCGLLGALDAELAADTGATLGVSFGIEPGLIWRGHLLGLAPDARGRLAARLRACLGEPRGPARDEAALRDVEALVEAPTSLAWEDAVRRVLLAAYDEDRSGALDPVEVERLPCPLWRHLEGAALSARDRPLLVVYGIADGYLWVGDALGIELAAREQATAAGIACGLAAD
ncbi:MAG: hypothetical protein IT385_25245 [Deltaproteobacteria bacterium]|nr:hypothetical protein [Deltaproteobacteria bacterium]